MTKSFSRVVAELAELKTRFGAGDAKILRALRVLSKSKFTDASELIRFHEALLFLHAYPASVEVLKQVEAILQMFEQRVIQLREMDADLSPLDDPEASGIVGTSVTSNFSYPIVCWLAAKYPAQLRIDWDWFDEEERFGATMPQFLPLLEEEAMVEAHVAYRDYLRAAKGRANEVVWLIERFKALKVSEKEKAGAYDSLKIHVHWEFGARASRTGMKLPERKVFFHDRPLIARREISLADELKSAPILRLMRQLLGVTVLSIDPYQVGHENEEGIESGAFWFYRKLGFRPTRPDLLKLAISEERRLSADPRRRTSARTLRRLAAGHMLFELSDASAAGGKGEWDQFQIRNVGLAVQKRMAREFDGDAQEIREHSIDFVERNLGSRIWEVAGGARSAIENLALLCAMTPIDRWTSADKQLATRIIQAKGRGDESLYLKLMQKHSPLRAAVIRLGS